VIVGPGLASIFALGRVPKPHTTIGWRISWESLVCDRSGAIAYLDRDVGSCTRTALTPIVCAQAKLVQCPPVFPAREAWQVIAHGA
jgi:hypothetical protein